MREMKTAICFTGTGRSLEYTGDNIRKFLVEAHPGCDVFIHVAETEHAGNIERHFTLGGSLTGPWESILAITPNRRI